MVKDKLIYRDDVDFFFNKLTVLKIITAMKKLVCILVLFFTCSVSISVWAQEKW